VVYLPDQGNIDKIKDIFILKTLFAIHNVLRINNKGGKGIKIRKR